MGFGRFGQLDAGEPPPVADPPVAAQDRHGLTDLGGRQWPQRGDHALQVPSRGRLSGRRIPGGDRLDDGQVLGQ
jgi:hypothetical protein